MLKYYLLRIDGDMDPGEATLDAEIRHPVAEGLVQVSLHLQLKLALGL